MKNKKVVISPPERRELSRRMRSRTIGAEDARRARVILALGSGLGVRAVAGMLRCSSSYVQRWRERFLGRRLAGLVARHQGRKVRPDAAKLEARILEWTRRGPQDGTTQWSSRRLAAVLGTNHMTISRVWARHGLQPHRLRRYLLSNDPDFEKKAAEIIALYLNPPDHVFGADGIDRRFYELCVMVELKNALRSGDVSVSGSRQFRAFEEYLMPHTEFNERLANGSLNGLLPHVKITDLLLEINRWTVYSVLRPFEERRTSKHPTLLLTAILRCRYTPGGFSGALSLFAVMLPSLPPTAFQFRSRNSLLVSPVYSSPESDKINVTSA